MRAVKPGLTNIWRPLAIAAACLLLMSGPATAQATRTWVSGVGDDVNPCSRTAPCKTFAGAISKTAASGIINCVDPGGFGAVTITKSLTIDCDPGHGGILVSGSSGIIINIGVNDEVILRNLSFEGIGMGLNGVNVQAAGTVVVDHCVFNGFSLKAINFASTSPGFLFVSNTEIINNAGGGIFIQNARATISNVRLEKNLAFGVFASLGAIVSVVDSVASTGQMGFVAGHAASAVLNLSRCLTTHNDYGVVVSSGATVRMSEVEVFSNAAYGVFSDGISNLYTYQNNKIAGNPSNSAFTGTIAVI